MVKGHLLENDNNYTIFVGTSEAVSEGKEMTILMSLISCSGIDSIFSGNWSWSMWLSCAILNEAVKDEQKKKEQTK